MPSVRRCGGAQGAINGTLAGVVALLTAVSYLAEAMGLLDAAAEHGDEHEGGQADEVEGSPAEPAPLQADGQTDGYRHRAEGVEGQQGSEGPTPAGGGELLHDHGDADGQFRADEYAGAELEDHEGSEAPRQGGEGGEGGVADD